MGGFSCGEGEAVRYKQSVACRVRLRAAAAGAGAPTLQPSSFFYKRAVLRELPYALQKAVTYPYKIARDVRSNQVEAVFLSSELLKGFATSSGVQVALPYRVEQV